MVFKPFILVFSTKRIFELSCCECCFIVVLQLYQGSSCILDFGTDVFHLNSGTIKLWLVLSSALSRCLSSGGETGSHSQAVLMKMCCMQLNLLARLNLLFLFFNHSSSAGKYASFFCAIDWPGLFMLLSFAERWDFVFIVT